MEQADSESAEPAKQQAAGPVRRFLLPSYDEASLFLMGLAFLLLFVTDPQLRTEANRYLFRYWDPRSYLAAALLVVGLALSFYHVFTRRPKSDFAKAAMLFLAVMVNGSSGIAAGFHLLTETPGLLIFFPIWNILNGFFLLIAFRFELLDIDCIAERDAEPLEVAAGSVVMLVAFALCRFHFELYWAVTFSICVAYATSFSEVVRRLVAHPEGAQRERDDRPAPGQGAENG
ncbi:MAG: hypothetical protein R6X33_12925 [Candidatus Brocadiia bacterium]